MKNSAFLVASLFFIACAYAAAGNAENRAAPQKAKTEQEELKIPRVSKPWKEALRLVGGGLQSRGITANVLPSD